MMIRGGKRIRPIFCMLIAEAFNKSYVIER